MTILLVAAVIPPLFLLYRVYRLDKIEREPRGLIVLLFVIGCITVIPAAIIEGIVIGALEQSLDPRTHLYLFIENFLCVGLVEELVKYYGTKLGSWRNKAFNYCFDGVVYAVTVSLGFATAENIMYVFSYGMEVAILRALTAIPGHCIFGIFMGYYYGMAKYVAARGDSAKSLYLRIMAILMPTLLHGFYDFCASSGNGYLIMGFYVYIIVLDLFAFLRIRAMSAADAEIV